MTFTSWQYLLVFLPGIVILYHLFRTFWFVNVFVLAFSYYFYGSSALWYLLPLMVTSLIDFYVGMKLDHTDQQRWRKTLLLVSIIANLGLLAFFKYTPWLIDSTNSAFVAAGISLSLPVLVVVLPPGISFYTFQTMSYTIEVYRKEMKASRNLVNYLSFVTFWPHLVAGPIMRAKSLLTQLETLRPAITADEFRYALILIGWGLFKKLVLADNFGYMVDTIDKSAHAGTVWPGAGLLFGYAFAGQIYCDFSAYTDIARGSAKLVGIELGPNFRSPYLSASPTEFWRRWHISLSTWLRDYLYIPLGGNRRGARREYFNLLVTMVLGGIWHGAGLLFVLWGLLHGVLLIVHKVFPYDRYLERYLGPIGRAIAILITFHLVVLGWMLFRGDLGTIGPLLASIPALFEGSNLVVFTIVGRGVAALAVVVLVTDLIGYWKNVEFVEVLGKINPYVAATVMALCYFGVTILAKRESAQFIYFQF